MDKKYKLEIPRAQFDRIGAAFELEDQYVNGYNPKTDTVIFTVTEKQRKYFAKFAKKQNNPDIPKKLRGTYWITQMFLSKNIQYYEVQQ